MNKKEFTDKEIYMMCVLVALDAERQMIMKNKSVKDYAGDLSKYTKTDVSVDDVFAFFHKITRNL